MCLTVNPFYRLFAVLAKVNYGFEIWDIIGSLRKILFHAYLHVAVEFYTTGLNKHYEKFHHLDLHYSSL